LRLRYATLNGTLRFLPVLPFLLLAALALRAQNPSSHEPVLDVSSMDRSVDPCTDFYTYACGGWMKKNPIPPDQASWDVYSKLEDQNRLVLRGILEKAALPSPDRNSVTQKIGDYYAACMDEKAIDAAGIQPLQPTLDQIAALQSKQDIAQLAALMMDDGALFEFLSDQDYKNSSQVIAEVDQGGLGLPDRDFYRLRDARTRKIRRDYVAHVQRIFELLGDAPDDAQNEARSVMRIETALARGSMSRVDHRDPQKVYHKMSRAELEALSPAFQWDTYFAKTGVPSVQSLNVATPEFFKVLSRELKKQSVASWKSYLRWHLAHANALYLSPPFVDATFAFYGKTLLGEQTLEPRWKRCVNHVDADLGEALGQAYVQQKFPPQAKQQVLKMVKQIEAAMQQDIESLPWMSAATKQQALDKLRAVGNKIGYPDKWRDYSSLAISRDDEMGNVLRARAFEFRRQLAKIGKPVDRGEWSMTPATVNAYYDAQLNDVNFPAGILQPPVFDPSSDDAPNYGDTGATIGHELTHGFDDAGREFDARGNMRDWWTPADSRQFEKRTSCIVDQYSHYTAVDHLKVNGKLTLGENVADLGGLILAYMAWQEQANGQKLGPIDRFTPEQRFFIGYGQSWCANVREEDKRLRVMGDPHSPEQYRTNGVVSDMPEFQQAFHCKPDAPMVRKDRCRVW
jgi:putative endopeptidase